MSQAAKQQRNTDTCCKSAVKAKQCWVRDFRVTCGSVHWRFWQCLKQLFRYNFLPVTSTAECLLVTFLRASFSSLVCANVCVLLNYLIKMYLNYAFPINWSKQQGYLSQVHYLVMTFAVSFQASMCVQPTFYYLKHIQVLLNGFWPNVCGSIVLWSMFLRWSVFLINCLFINVDLCKCFLGFVFLFAGFWFFS